MVNSGTWSNYGGNQLRFYSTSFFTTLITAKTLASTDVTEDVISISLPDMGDDLWLWPTSPKLEDNEQYYIILFQGRESKTSKNPKTSFLRPKCLVIESIIPHCTSIL